MTSAWADLGFGPEVGLDRPAEPTSTTKGSLGQAVKLLLQVSHNAVAPPLRGVGCCESAPRRSGLPSRVGLELGSEEPLQQARVTAD